MFKWTPKPPSNIGFNQNQERSLYAKRIICLVGIFFLGCFLVFLLPSNSIPAIAILFITAILFLVLYIRWRSFFLSYWYAYHTGSSYYEDYTWKDSLVIALILIVSIGLSGLFLFFIASKSDFSSLQSVAKSLSLLAKFFIF